MIRFEWTNDGPTLQQFLEPNSIIDANVEIVFANLDPGCAYQIKNLLPLQADGTTPWEDGFSHNDLSYLYWPVSNLADEPYSRETLVSNVAFNIHHTRLTESQHAVRIRTFPPSSSLQTFEDNITFGIFMESNVNTNVSISTVLVDGNIMEFNPQIEYFELGSTYTFDYSNYHHGSSIQLIRYDNTGNAITLSSLDQTGVMTVTLTDPDLVGETVYVTKDQSVNAHMMTGEVRDGSVRRLYQEFHPPVPFEDLFGDGFQTRVLECAIDPTYDRYDVFITMRNGNDRYITSHAFAHTVEPQGDYPSPQTIAIHSVEKTQPSNAVSFEYPSGYYVGLQFRVKEVGLQDMYQFILFTNQ